MDGVSAVIVPFAIGLIASGIRLATPILFAALGETITEKAGVLNIGIEGTMLIGAWAGFIAAFHTGSPGVGLAAGALAACFVGVLVAFLVVNRATDQIVTGIMINIFCLGLSTLIFQKLYAGRLSGVADMMPVQVPVLSSIPVLGPMLFDHIPPVYLAILLVPPLHILLNRSSFGLSLQACGEDPRVADTAGINVRWVRWACVILGAALMGLGGATLSVGELGGFRENLTAGRGFIALAVVALGRWNAYGVLLGALLFGLVDALQLRLQALGVGVPHQVLLMLPYILTVLVLVGVAGGARFPAAVGKPYLREEAK